jgi:hypothetical protein
LEEDSSKTRFDMPFLSPFLTMFGLRSCELL